MKTLEQKARYPLVLSKQIVTLPRTGDFDTCLPTSQWPSYGYLKLPIYSSLPTLSPHTDFSSYLSILLCQLSAALVRISQVIYPFFSANSQWTMKGYLKLPIYFSQSRVNGPHPDTSSYLSILDQEPMALIRISQVACLFFSINGPYADISSPLPISFNVVSSIGTHSSK